ncbi:hypothetical protein BDZ91DRAFT_777622 [Kalaharituber pfeilii]|nr:hypothetical protein BDZ91DRAFT_777622 [Kalaharituber pfeilii]
MMVRIRCPAARALAAACERAFSPAPPIAALPAPPAADLCHDCRRLRRSLRHPLRPPSQPENPPLPPSRSPQSSAKLAALHARLSLHPSFPLETLARCLIDPSCEPNAKLNNASLSNLGNNLLGYFTTEHLLALYSVGREWGVEHAFEPTPEADAGLLQFTHVQPRELWGPQRFFETQDPKDLEPKTPAQLKEDAEKAEANRHKAIPLTFAMANFVKAVFAGIYLHESPRSAYQFFKAHILSRHLDVHKLFDFDQPTRHLSRLCAREGFPPPVARLLAETGRRTRSPVFVVGAYSGEERLGEGYGASMDEARIRAAVAALKAWYLYSPVEGKQDLETGATGEIGGQPGVNGFRPVYVDVGEVIV